MQSILTIVSKIEPVIEMAIDVKDVETIKILKGLIKECKKTFKTISAFSAEID